LLNALIQTTSETGNGKNFLFTWGDTTFGQIGNNTDYNSTYRIEFQQLSTSVLSANTNWKSVSVGRSHIAAITSNGILYTWGANPRGQLGSNNLTTNYTPTNWVGFEWNEVAAGYNHTTAIRSDGTLWSWGENIRLGNWESFHRSSGRSSPVQIGVSPPVWLGRTKTNSYLPTISAGWNNPIMIRSTVEGQTHNVPYRWGFQPNSISLSSPVMTTTRGYATPKSALMIASGTSNYLYIGEERGLYIHGDSTYGGIGRPIPLDPYYFDFVELINDVTFERPSWTMADSGFGNILAIRTNGLLFGWGRNDLGQVGDGTIINKSSPVQIGTSSWTQVACGLGHNLAIRSDGRLFAWGINSFGEVGDGTITLRSSPVQIGTSSWIFVAAGENSSAAIRIDGRIFTWGKNGFGQLGDGTQVSKSSPISIGTNSWTQVDAGGNHIAAIRSDGALFTWGANDRGQLGDGTAISKSSPVQIGTSSWAQVSAGYSMTMGQLASDTYTGLVYVWGGDNPIGFQYEMLGIPGVVSRSSPVVLGAPNYSDWKSFVGISFTQISSKQWTTFALASDGRLFGWGQNDIGQIGNSSTKFSIGDGEDIPYQIPGSWIQVSTTFNHTAAINSSFKLFTWGYNNNGQLGDGTVINRSSPVQIGNKSWSRVLTTEFNTIAIDYSGNANTQNLFTWGRGDTILLAEGTTISRSSPVQVGSDYWNGLGETETLAVSSKIANNNETITYTQQTWGANVLGTAFTERVSAFIPLPLGTLEGGLTGALSPVFVNTSVSYDSNGKIKFSEANGRAALITSNNKLFLAGENTFGGSSVGHLGSRANPNIPLLNTSKSTRIGLKSWKQVAAGSAHKFAIRSDGALFAWGGNGAGQLGDGTRISRSSPVQIGTSSWNFVSTASNHTLAIRADGTLWTWGLNDIGQLGTNNRIARSSPVQIGGGDEWQYVEVDFDMSIALSGTPGNCTLYAWGRNTDGQLGDGTVINRSLPVIIGNALDWKSASCGTSKMAAIDSSGRLFAWGNWDGVFTRRSSPVQVGTSSWAQVNCGSNHALLLKENNTLWSFGVGQTGQLGVDVSIPTNYFDLVENYTDHSVAIKSNGTLWTWGKNTNGQLGDNTRTSRSSPVQVGTSSWIAVAAGAEHTLAIRVDGKLFGWGLDSDRQLGNPASAVSRSSPTQIGTSNWLKVAAAAKSSFGIRDNGTLWAWGNNDYGILGTNDTVTKISPVQIGSDTWSQIYASLFGPSFEYGHVYGIKTDGSLWAWGYNFEGQLGDGTITLRSSPVQIKAGTSFIAASAGKNYGHFIDTTYKLHATGTNLFGQLGDGTTVYKSSPVQIGTSSWTQIGSGDGTTYAVTPNGVLWRWGSGFTPSSSPVQVGSYSLIGSARNAGETVFIHGPLTSNNYVTYVTGSNLNGEAGLNSTGSGFLDITSMDDPINAYMTTYVESLPVQIGTKTWNSIQAGIQNSFAIDTNYVLYSWGRNGFGQLTDGTTINRSSPVQLSGGFLDSRTRWNSISVNANNAVAILRR
jgi:alpha-tubulin suppressor-like RCC1 family protein